MARNIEVRLLGDNRDLVKALDDSESRIGTFSKNAGKLIAGAAVAVGAGAALLAKSSISAASDLQETLSKSNTIFGENADEIREWAKSAAKSFGQSQQEALDAAASFGNMFDQLGIGPDLTADMSTAITELASDFASFHNADISEVLNAQQAAFRGEYDAIQRFIPTMNAAAVEQRALELSGKATTAELTAQDKALAANALMMEGAGAAAGDFARTSDSLANRQRIMAAEWENVKASIGEALIPAMTAAVGFISESVIPTIRALSEKYGPGLTAAFQAISDWTEENWPKIRDTIVGVIDAVKAIIETVTAVITVIWETWGDEIVAFLKVTWETIRTVVQAAIDVVRGIIQTVTALIRGDWSGAWEGIKLILSGVLDAMKAIISGFIATVKLALKGAWDGIKLQVEFVWEGIKTFLSNTWESIKNTVSDGIDAVVGFVTGLPGRISDAVAGAFNGIYDNFKAVINKIIDAWNGLEFPGITIPGFDPPGPGSFPSFSTPSIGFPNVPRLHTGGVYRAPAGQSEGYALLQDRETVFTDDQMEALGNMLRPTAIAGPGAIREAARRMLRDEINRYFAEAA